MTEIKRKKHYLMEMDARWRLEPTPLNQNASTACRLLWNAKAKERGMLVTGDALEVDCLNCHKNGPFLGRRQERMRERANSTVWGVCKCCETFGLVGDRDRRCYDIKPCNEQVKKNAKAALRAVLNG